MRTEVMKSEQGESQDRRFDLRALLRPHLPALIIAFVASLGETIANLAEPWPIKIVLDNVLQGKPLKGWLASWTQTFFHGEKQSVLAMAVAAVVVIALAGAIFSYLESVTTTRIGQLVMHDLRSRLYAQMQRLSLAYHDRAQTGDLISRVTSDVDAVQSFVANGMLGALVDLLTLVGMVAIMACVDWRFTLIALSIVPALFVLVYTYTRRIKKASREVRKKEGQIVAVIQEVLSSMRVVKAFSREDYEVQRMSAKSLDSVETAMRARAMKARLSPLVDVLVAAGTGLVLWVGAQRVLGDGLSAGTLVMFILYLGKMYKPIQDLSKTTDSWSKASVGYERILEVLDMQTLRERAGAKKAPRFRGAIEFSGIDFEYEPGQPVLRGFDLKIPAGSVVAFVGPTGAGKSSIAGLIARFYEPQAGRISIDGIDIRNYTVKSLRDQMSFVLQDTVLFHGAIWENIAYGRPNATRREIEHAAQLANAEEFIVKMPEGYDTLVGERGMTLSGGQRQRIGIARAVIRNTPILILDEPTSGLDALSEQLVVEALQSMMKGRTTLVIAHRLSTIRNADSICVIEDGKLVEQGTHEELMARDSLYAELTRTQAEALEHS